ncbi:MAG: hypothetical protein SV186_00150 [Candidatus Nanohaloarchaea archaeon]|nr:hypothetical protein [Candidatus Nanohaloarchaea archaeon]
MSWSDPEPAFITGRKELPEKEYGTIHHDCFSEAPFLISEVVTTGTGDAEQLGEQHAAELGKPVVQLDDIEQALYYADQVIVIGSSGRADKVLDAAEDYNVNVFHCYQ